MTRQSNPKTGGNTLKSLILPTLGGFLFGVIALGVVLFLPAWTLAYWQAWAFILVFMGLVSLNGLYFSIKDPALIERRKTYRTSRAKVKRGEIQHLLRVPSIAGHAGPLRPGPSLRVVADARQRMHPWRRVGGDRQRYLVIQ